MVIACGAVIWLLGSDSFAASETSRYLGPLLDWLFPWFTPEQHDQALYYLRKPAHLIEYGALALVSIRALLLTLTWSPTLAVAASLCMVLALASADEVRQGLTANRTGTPVDVLFDLAGACLALAGFFLLRRWRDRSDESR